MSMRGHGTESGREAVKTSAAGRAEENAHDAIEKMDHSAVTDMAEASDRREEPGAESFFFKAEDGIRDSKVTGVQTWALPISGRPPKPPGPPGRWPTPGPPPGPPERWPKPPPEPPPRPPGPPPGRPMPGPPGPPGPPGRQIGRASCRERV